jgi:CubicO group peptidase (beta-lactamase class C family)
MTWYRRFLSARFLLTIVVSSRLTAGAAAPLHKAASPPRTTLSSSLNEYFRRMEAHGFSGAVLVSDHGKVVLAEGYGLADRPSGTPVKADTIFQIASLDKQFIAAAILRLEMEGRLHVSDTLAQYLPAILGRHGAQLDPHAPDFGGITLHQLLSHTSGLTSLYPEQNGSWKNYLEKLLREPLVAPPGTRVDYSNSGYDLLAQIVETVSGMPLGRFLENRFFTPLGMHDTGDTSRPWPRARPVIRTGKRGSWDSRPTSRPSARRCGGKG